jgi:predicted aldo/keto reductase-like oxidoreductase
MPVFSCGGMRYQQAWEDLAPDTIKPDGQANLEATIRRSLELGINHIETARGYGSSEMQLGRILPTLPREDMIIQTKVPPKPTADEFLRTFDTSLDYLGLEYVDLLGLHGINNPELLDQALRKGGCVDAARKLQAAGRVRFIGFSTHGLPRDILAAIESDEFDYVNLHWYYFDQRNADCIEAATARDMGVFIISPNDKGGKLYEPPARLEALCSPLTPMGFNDLFCLSDPRVHTLSLGASCPSDFDAHLDILPLLDSAESAIAPVLERLDQRSREVLGDKWTDSWATGLPTWEEVPGDVPVYHVLRLYTMWCAFDMLEFARMRYNLLGNGDHWFAGRKVDPDALAGIGEALSASPFADKLEDIIRDAHMAFNAADQKRLSES